MSALPDAHELVEAVVFEFGDGANEEVLALARCFLDRYLRYRNQYFFDVGQLLDVGVL